MIKIELEKMIEIVDGKLTNAINIEPKLIEIDSRRVTAETYFMPILGEVHDGHKFIVNAFENGAQISFCEKAYYYGHLEDLKTLPLILVDNTTKALHKISQYVLKMTQVKTIGITGSVGKTSTKEFVYYALRKHFNVHKNKGNFNNHIGMPLTIFDLEPSHEVAILEMGMNHFKEIETLADIARPHISLITNIGTSHIGILGSRENIFQAKLEITSYLEDKDTLIVNGEDEFLCQVDHTPFNLIKVGSEILYKNVNRREDGCYDYTLVYEGEHKVSLNVLGRHNVLNSMLAIMTAVQLGVPVSEACKNISDYKDSSKRLEIIEGRKNSIVINDCYNASQESMISAIDVLNGYANDKVAVLGDVLELGSFAQASHEAVGAYIAENPVDILYTFGKDSRYIIEKASINPSIKVAKHFEAIEDLHEALEEVMASKVILIKGSFGMGMSRTVTYLGGNNDRND